MPEVTETDPFDPQKIFDDLMVRCRESKAWNIQCIVNENFVGLAPFDIIIEDGIFHCRVVAPTMKDAYIKVANCLPVIKFLKYKNGS